MIVKAAVKIFDKKQNKELILPAHRLCDIFYILKQFGYSKKDYKEIAQGFLDEHDNFYNRVEAYKHAVKNNQIIPENPNYVTELYSEDLY
ncbi:MAG: hypothetical protein J6T10_23230 [Methanobrevibacter sp.]|nr:hypothetical protein [Methanobrevibacter sp.]